MALAGVLLMGAGAWQPLQAQNQTVSGDLGVTGALDVYGNMVNLGAWSDDPARFGLRLTYAEDASHAATLTLSTLRPVSGWLWQAANPANPAASVPQMRLSPGNALTLYDQAMPTRNAAIVLDPAGISFFGTSATFNGPSNLMPYQTVAGSASVLTVGLADARYAVHGTGNTVALGIGANASGDSALALGSGARAASAQAVALGANSNADGYLAMALGENAYAADEALAMDWNAVASGSVSMALGHAAAATSAYSVAVGPYARAAGAGAAAFGLGANATGDNSVALSNGAVASGFASLALGCGSAATYYFAASLGYYSTASGYLSSAFGAGSLAGGDNASAFGGSSAATGWASEALGFHAAADGTNALALGNYSHASGNYATALSNSAVASGDYAVAAGRTEAASLYQTTVGAYGVAGGDAHNWVPTDDLFTVGNGQSANAPSNAFSVRKNGDAAVSGNLQVGGTIMVQPQGDLSMGEFTARPTPGP